MTINQQLPIAIDLDGTLVFTDTLHEAGVQLFHQHPIKALLLPFWLIGGKAILKQKVAELTSLNPATLPYNTSLIEWLNEQKALGYQLILCTAADISIATSVASHLNLFDSIIASDGQRNLAGKNKRDALVARFGEQGFIYAGNSNADIDVWAAAAKAVVVSEDESLIKKASSLAPIEKVFRPPPITINSWRRVLRIHQYLKNLLLFIPLLSAHQISNYESLGLLVLAFISFSLCASTVYIANDLIDLDSDRQHVRKRYRPFAAGVVPISYGVVFAPIFLTFSLTMAWYVGFGFFVWLMVYFIITVAYSLRLKRYVLVDCLTLAALYTLRIIAGAAAVAISLSFWLLAFSVFLFLSLAFVKRYAELQIQKAQGNKTAHGRGYHVDDAPLIQTLGISAGYGAVLVLALYLHSEAVERLYKTPEFIWASVPLILFWISWVWLKAHRGLMHDDPIVFAVRDKCSNLVGIFMILVFFLAS